MPPEFACGSPHPQCGGAWRWKWGGEYDTEGTGCLQSASTSSCFPFRAAGRRLCAGWRCRRRRGGKIPSNVLLEHDSFLGSSRAVGRGLLSSLPSWEKSAIFSDSRWCHPPRLEITAGTLAETYRACACLPRTALVAQGPQQAHRKATWVWWQCLHEEEMRGTEDSHGQCWRHAPCRGLKCFAAACLLLRGGAWPSRGVESLGRSPHPALAARGPFGWFLLPPVPQCPLL